MKVSTERIPDSQVVLTIEVEPERVDRYVERAYRSLVNRVNVPGFRRGKAPRFILERVVGKEMLLHDGLEKLVPDVLAEAMQEADVTPVGEPKLEVVQEDPLIVKATVPVRPTVELGNYRDVRLTKEQPVLEEKQVAEAIERLREEHANLLPVERSSQMGDTVTIDIEGHTLGESLLEGVAGGTLVASEGTRLLSSNNVDYLLKPQPESPLAGLTEQMVGMAPGEEREIRLNLPAHYPEEEMRGKPAVFKVKVHAIREKQLPTLDDEFAKTLGDFETWEACEKAIREGLQKGLEQQAEERLTDTIVKTIVDRSHAEFPPSVVEAQVDRMVERLEDNLKRQGLTLHKYLDMMRQTRDEMRESMRPEARKRVETSLVLLEVAKAEGLEVAPEEIDAEIERIVGQVAQGADKTRTALNSPDMRERLESGLMDRKLLQRLVQIATAEEEGEPDVGGKSKSEGGSVETEEPASE
ncbi:MAG: trigger factor [Chloroflexi bacterium]|nr:trigger factor [Chloroflexota bacterium]